MCWGGGKVIAFAGVGNKVEQSVARPCSHAGDFAGAETTMAYAFYRITKDIQRCRAAALLVIGFNLFICLDV